MRDIVVDDGLLYVLTETLGGKGAGTILATADASCSCADAFVSIATINGDFWEPRSLERADDRFYVGCADGKLIRSTPYTP